MKRNPDEHEFLYGGTIHEAFKNESPKRLKKPKEPTRPKSPSILDIKTEKRPKEPKGMKKPIKSSPDRGIEPKPVEPPVKPLFPQEEIDNVKDPCFNIKLLVINPEMDYKALPEIPREPPL